MKLSAIVAAAAAGTAAAHLCTFQPLQRGGAIGADGPHADVCFQQNGPCPAPAATPVAYYTAGERIQVVMQKNLDHFYAAAPGNFSVYLWDQSGKSVFWGSVPDSAAPTLSLYPIDLDVPTTIPSGNYTVQTIYSTNNPGAPPTFYQCSDVVVLNLNTEAAAKVDATGSHDCLKEHQ